MTYFSAIDSLKYFNNSLAKKQWDFGKRWNFNMDAYIGPSRCLHHFCCVSDLLLNTHVPLHFLLLSFVLLSRAVFLLQRQLTEALDSDLFGPVTFNAFTGAVNASENL